MSRVRRVLALVALLALLLSGCGSDEEPPVDHEGLHMCCELGAYCHPPPGTLPDEQRQHCHNLGHANDPGACRAEYEACMALCADNAEASEHYCAE